MTAHQFLWFDLETTGLDPASGHVLEFAAVLAADAPGDTLAPVQEYTAVIHAPADARDRADAFVQRMHDANGLWRESAASTITLADADAFLAELAAEQTGGRERAITLAGNSVHFDLAWSRVHLPRFARFLSHRVFDVSTLRRFVETYCRPGAGAARWQWPDRRGTNAPHRALHDVRASLEETRLARLAMPHTITEVRV